MSDSSWSYRYVGVAEWGRWREHPTVSTRTVPGHHIHQETLPAAVWRMWNGKKHTVVYFSLLVIISSHCWYNITCAVVVSFWMVKDQTGLCYTFDEICRELYCLTVNIIMWSFFPIDKFWTTSQCMLFIVSDKFVHWCVLVWGNLANLESLWI